MQKYYIILIFFLTLMANQAMCQNKKDTVSRPWINDTTRRYALSLSPLQFFFKGWEDNFDIRIKRSRSWISLSPEIYYNSILNNSKNIGDNAASGKSGLPYKDLLYGAAIGVQHKIYFSEEPRQHTRNFIAYGIKYSHYHIDIKDYAWKEYDQYGLHFYNFLPTTGYYNIDRLDIGFYLGVQKVIRQHYFIDLYTGLQYSTVLSEQTNMPGYRKYDTSIFDYAYKGPAPVIGLRLGYFILWREN